MYKAILMPKIPDRSTKKKQFVIDISDIKLYKYVIQQMFWSNIIDM